MKNAVLLCIAFIASSTIYSQNNGEPTALGLPGDNLNLYAVLNIFQQSKTLEDFERAINDQSNNINNLDLNNDQNIDYLKVVGHQVSNTHTIVIQDPINGTEVQDVAVIEVSKEASGKVFIQIIGDEALYGKDYIIEPSDMGATGTPNPGYNGSSGTVVVNNNGYENNYRPVDDWLIVSFLFSPAYVTYHSPFYWGYYPTYWHPWHPVFYENYWGYNRHYYRDNYYQRSVVIRSPVYYSHYEPRRISSQIVIHNYNNGGYRGTYNGHDYRKPQGLEHRDNAPRVDNNNAPRANNINNNQPRANSINNPRPRNNNNAGHLNNINNNALHNNNTSNPRSTQQPANNHAPANHAPSTTAQPGQQFNNAPRTSAPRASAPAHRSQPRASAPRPAPATPRPSGREESGEGRR